MEDKIKKSFIVSVNGEGVTADLLIKNDTDFESLDALIWNVKKSINEDKPISHLNKHAPIYFFGSIVLFFCVLLQVMMGVFYPIINTGFTDNNFYQTEEAYTTKVWYRGEIVWSEYDRVSSVNDSLVTTRNQQAKQFIKAITK